MIIKANARSLNALRSEYLTVVRKLIKKKKGDNRGEYQTNKSRRLILMKRRPLI